MLERMPRRSALIVSFSAFLLGMLWGQFFGMGAPLFFSGGFGVCFLALAFVLRRQTVVVLTLLAAGMLSIGMLRMGVHMERLAGETVYLLNDTGREVELVGVLRDEPVYRSTYTSGLLTVDAVDGTLATGKVALSLPRYPEIPYGARVTVRGKLVTPKAFDDFDYAAYLRRHGALSTLRGASVVGFEAGHGNVLREVLFSGKRVFEGALNQVFHEPVASIAAGLLTGSRGMIPEETLDNFSATGLTHLIAISGFNIALVIAFAVAVTRRLGGGWVRHGAVIVAVVLFTLFVGASPPVVRAAIMGLTIYVALIVGSQVYAALLMLFAATVMAMLSPLILAYDASFQLSFAATLGITYIAPRMQQLLSSVPERFALREGLAMTLAAQLATAPLIAWHFGAVSIVAVLANMLVVPVVPLIMLLAGITGIAGLCSWVVGVVVSLPAYLLIRYMLAVADLLSGVPFAEVTLPFWLVALGALGVGVIVVRR